MKDKEYRWILEEKYNGVKNENFLQDIEKLESGTPVDFIIGNKPFLNCKIDLSKKPLIPRSETEFWVNKLIEDIKSKNLNRLDFLDLFAGSGCIGISILKNIENSFVDFGEINKDFIDQIEINANLNNIDKKRFNIIETDIFKNINRKYDYIFANPPYISKDNIDSVEKSVINFEPHEALFAKNEGLYFIEKLIEEFHNFLHKNGKIFIEFDSWQKEKIEEILTKKDIAVFKFMKDQYNEWRVLIISNIK